LIRKRIIKKKDLQQQKPNNNPKKTNKKIKLDIDLYPALKEKSYQLTTATTTTVTGMTQEQKQKRKRKMATTTTTTNESKNNEKQQHEQCSSIDDNCYKVKHIVSYNKCFSQRSGESKENIISAIKFMPSSNVEGKKKSSVNNNGGFNFVFASSCGNNISVVDAYSGKLLCRYDSDSEPLFSCLDWSAAHLNMMVSK